MRKPSRGRSSPRRGRNGRGGGSSRAGGGAAHHGHRAHRQLLQRLLQTPCCAVIPSCATFDGFTLGITFHAFQTRMTNTPSATSTSSRAAGQAPGMELASAAAAGATSATGGAMGAASSARLRRRVPGTYTWARDSDVRSGRTPRARQRWTRNEPAARASQSPRSAARAGGGRCADADHKPAPDGRGSSGGTALTVDSAETADAAAAEPAGPSAAAQSRKTRKTARSARSDGGGERAAAARHEADAVRGGGSGRGGLGRGRTARHDDSGATSASHAVPAAATPAPGATEGESQRAAASRRRRTLEAQASEHHTRLAVALATAELGVACAAPVGEMDAENIRLLLLLAFALDEEDRDAERVAETRIAGPPAADQPGGRRTGADSGASASRIESRQPLAASIPHASRPRRRRFPEAIHLRCADPGEAVLLQSAGVELCDVDELWRASPVVVARAREALKLARESVQFVKAGAQVAGSSAAQEAHNCWRRLTATSEGDCRLLPASATDGRGGAAGARPVAPVSPDAGLSALCLAFLRVRLRRLRPRGRD